MYEYLIWTALLGIVWAAVYFLKPALRRKILWSSLISLPFGFGELYFIPNYWAPKTLFDFGIKYSIDIEAFLLMFFLGGIAAFVYEGFFKNRVPNVQRFCHPVCRCYTPLLAALASFIIMIKAFPGLSIIYSASLACLIGGSAAFFMYSGLRKHILFGGVLFAFLYWISLAIVELLFPGWITGAWNSAAISGITLTDVPIEEIMFGFCFGTLWTSLFEETCSNMHVR